MAENNSEEPMNIYYDKIKNVTSIFNENEEIFSNFTTNLERIQWICQVPKLNELDEKCLPIQRQYPGKTDSIAAFHKEQGNAAFKVKKWSEALNDYSASYISVPDENGK